MTKQLAKCTFLALAGLALAGTVVAQDSKGRGGPGDKTFGEEEQIEQRKKWFNLKRGLDSVNRPDLLRAAAIEEIRKAGVEGGEAWYSWGPRGLSMPNWAMGPVAGRVSALAVGGNGRKMYLGSASGGLWSYTIEENETYEAISLAPTFKDLPALSIGSLAVDPNDERILWIGTGEEGHSCTPYMGLGLFRGVGTALDDRNGSNATRLDLSYVTAVAVQPDSRFEDPVVLAGGPGYCDGEGNLQGGGLFRSIDNGLHWKKVLDGRVNNIVFDPKKHTTVYVTIGGNTSHHRAGVLKSADGGESFSQLTSGIPSGYNVYGLTRLAMAPSDSSILYALINRELYRTKDSGATWSLQNKEACEGQCNYNLALDVHPKNPSELLVGSIRPWRSTDGGKTLTPLTEKWGPAQTVHQDIHAVRYSRNGDRFWVGSDGGLWSTWDGGKKFRNHNSNLNTIQFYDIGVDPKGNGPWVFGGAQDNSTSNVLNVYSQVVEITGDGFTNMVDSGDANYVFITSYPLENGPHIYRSTEGGQVNTFRSLPTSGISPDNVKGFPWETELAMIQDSSASYLFTGSSHVFRAKAREIKWSWTLISGDLANSILSAFGNQVGGNTLYAGFQNGRIFRSDNALADSPSWTEVTNGIPHGFISDFAVDEANSQRVFVTRSVFDSPQLLRSTNGGATWTAVGKGLPNLPASAVAIDPRAKRTESIFVGTDVGVYVSEDNGDNFRPMMSGMPHGAVITDLEVQLRNNQAKLWAATYGSGVYERTLP